MGTDEVIRVIHVTVFIVQVGVAHLVLVIAVALLVAQRPQGVVHLVLYLGIAQTGHAAVV